MDPDGSNSQAYYGLVFRQNSAATQEYMFLISDGFATLIVNDRSSQDNPSKTLFDQVVIPKFNKVGKANHLKVVAIGDTITISVNDAPIGEVQDVTLTSGTIGFSFQSGDSKEQQVIFEHAKVTKMP
jgi:hypothetical protein